MQRQRPVASVANPWTPQHRMLSVVRCQKVQQDTTLLSGQLLTGCEWLTRQLPQRSEAWWKTRRRVLRTFTQKRPSGRDAALDVIIAAQDAIGASQDCCITAFSKKLRKHGRLLGPMARDGVGFQPIVWSAEGRPHPIVERVIGFAAEFTVRNHPEACEGFLYANGAGKSQSHYRSVLPE